MPGRMEQALRCWVATGLASLDQVLATSLSAHGLVPVPDPGTAQLCLLNPATQPASVLAALQSLRAGGADGTGPGVIAVLLDREPPGSPAWPTTLTDDVLRMPFDPLELGQRAQSVLRARRWAREGTPARMRVGNVEFDLTATRVALADHPVHLSAVEAALLCRLARQVGVLVRRPVLRAAAAAAAPGADARPALSDAGLTRLVVQLRRSLDEAGAQGIGLVSEYELGYRLLGDCTPA